MNSHFKYRASSVGSPLRLLTAVVLTSLFTLNSPVIKRHVRSVQISALIGQWSPVEWSQQCRWLSAVSSHQDERRASVSQRQRLHLDHRRPRAPAQLHRSWDHRRPAVWKGIKRIALQFICGNEPEPSHVHLSLNEFAIARQESHLASRLGRSDAARWFGRSRSCRDPRLLWPGSDSSGTSSPHLPWDKKGASELSVRCVCVCAWVSHSEYLKHQRRSDVPSKFFPTVTISPTRKDFRRQTGNERSMSKMVVAHCYE